MHAKSQPPQTKLSGARRFRRFLWSGLAHASSVGAIRTWVLVGTALLSAVGATVPCARNAVIGRSGAAHDSGDDPSLTTGTTSASFTIRSAEEGGLALNGFMDKSYGFVPVGILTAR